jgi:seryl-tRNA(Sec) selenium transferase
MWNRRWIFVAGLMACGFLAIQVASPLSAQQKENAPTDSAGKSDKEKEKAKEKELDIRYAKGYLKLMQATLEKYQETNRRLPNTIRPSVMQAIQENVREARERVQLAEKDDTSDAEIYVSGAESDLRSAQESLSKAEAANLQFNGTVSPPEIERLKADLELAQIKVERARHLASESPLSNVRFELEQLREDVQELRMFVALLRDRN